MKVLATIFALTVSSVAFAFPVVNDHLEWKLSGVSKSGVYEVTDGLTVKDYDSAKDVYLVEYSQTKDGATEAKEYWERAEDLAVPPFGDVLGNCVSELNGRLTTITVPAGTFPVCEFNPQLPDGVFVTWAMNFPFPMVKTITSSNSGDFVAHHYLNKFEVAPTQARSVRWFPRMQKILDQRALQMRTLQ